MSLSPFACWFPVVLLWGCSGAPGEPEPVTDCGCALDADYVGTVKYTLHQVYDQAKNTQDEDVVVDATSTRGQR